MAVSPSRRPVAGGPCVPKLVSGRFNTVRVAFVLFTQLIFLGTPWLRWDGRQAVWLDLEGQRIFLFGWSFWPQDLVYLAGVLPCAIMAMLVVYCLRNVDVLHFAYGLPELIARLRPGVLIGVSGQGGLFDEAVLTAMGEVCERPVILPLSNPTRSAEATPEQVWQATGGCALLATGSPFPPVVVAGEARVVSQCNNVYVFPGIGLGACAVKARRISDGMLLAAVRAVGAYPLVTGRLLPPIEQVGEVARAVARAVALTAREEGLADFDGDPAPLIDQT